MHSREGALALEIRGDCAAKRFPSDMVEELEQEYSALRDKVHDLQEYL